MWSGNIHCVGKRKKHIPFVKQKLIFGDKDLWIDVSTDAELKQYLHAFLNYFYIINGEIYFIILIFIPALFLKRNRETLSGKTQVNGCLQHKQKTRLEYLSLQQNFF